MTISDRIRDLRKSKGISQEELADKLNISRQAISKWESGQSVPDIEKIVLLSEYFNTTTDYIIKGTKTSDNVKRVPVLGAATMGVIIGTALNAIGLILSITLWYEFQRAYTVGVGLVFMILGTMLFVIGQAGDSKNRKKARKYFLMINVWILLLIPISCLQRGMMSPIPSFYMPYGRSIIPLCVYIGICLAVDIYLIKRK